MPRFDHEGDLTQQSQRPPQFSVRKVIADLTALARRSHQTAAAQASKMIGDVGPTFPQLSRKVGRVRRAIQQANEDLPANPVGHGCADTAQNIEPIVGAYGSNHVISIVQLGL